MNGTEELTARLNAHEAFGLASSYCRFAHIFGRCSLTCSYWANLTPLAMRA